MVEVMSPCYRSKPLLREQPAGTRHNQFSHFHVSISQLGRPILQTHHSTLIPVITKQKIEIQ